MVLIGLCLKSSYSNVSAVAMPKQIFSAEEFKNLLEKATECRIVRRGDKVKLKLRTPKMMYILVTSNAEANTLLKGVKVELKEI